MFNPSRDQARQFFIDSWAKFRRGDALTPLEEKTVAIITLHPEYHRVLQNPALLFQWILSSVFQHQAAKSWMCAE